MISVILRLILLVAALPLAALVVACEDSAPAPRSVVAKTDPSAKPNDPGKKGDDDDADDDDDDDGSGGDEDDEQVDGLDGEQVDGADDATGGMDTGATESGGTDSGLVDGDMTAEPPVEPLTDDEALAFLKAQCVSCHDAKDGSVKSFWALDPDTLAKAEFIASAPAPTVYQTLVMRSKEIVGGKPAAMPPKKLREELQLKLRRLLAWFEKEAPAAVATARARYGKGTEETGGSVGVILNYKCEQPATFREYIRRVTNDAFSREPKADELTLGEKGPDQPTTLGDRRKIAAKLLSDDAWKVEFLDKGLRKFGAKLSGAADIVASAPSLTQAQADDLKEEFYQILKNGFQTKTFKDILLSTKVMVSANTAALYGCTPPAAGEWVECDMQTPRASYFTTFSYLSSKPSSFLVENNNYGRAALLFFMIRGDVFKAANDQPGGGAGVRATPDCLESKDYRGKRGTAAVSPFGSLGVPKFANLCQSCHIQRQMAAGSILFRPYDKVGNIFGTGRPITGDPDFAAAIANDMVNSADGREEFVDQAFLENLLNGTSEKACVPGEEGKPDKILTSVSDLATYIIGDGVELAGGLARHLPRAMSNLGNTSEEIIISINKAWADGGGKLGPVFEAYFSSETYACSKR
jgi:hypothetical protein